MIIIYTGDDIMDRLEFEKNNIAKLHKMRLIATGLLVFMAALFIIFRRLGSQNLFFTSITAFAEAAMIGALADWFAVVALFRHPLGLKWIPHTAIIKNNKDRIGSSLSCFVVSNFFTEEVLMDKMKSINLMDEIAFNLEKNKGVLVEWLALKLPEVLKAALENTDTAGLLESSINSRVKDVKLYPMLGSFLEALVKSGQHKPIVKEILIGLHNYVNDNRDATMKLLESLNKTLAMPVIGPIVYKNVLKILSRQIDSIEDNTNSDMNKLLMFSLPSLIKKLNTSEKLIEKGEKFKTEILDSDLLKAFITSETDKVNEALKAQNSEANEKLREIIGTCIDILIKLMLNDGFIKEQADLFLKRSIVKVVCMYSEEISRLICDTVNNWEGEDISKKMEVQVGADLQYIRINGTVIGGLAGLAIHLATCLLA